MESPLTQNRRADAADSAFESRVAMLSLVVGVALLAVKFTAYFLTGSSAVFSDALGREFWKPSPAPYEKIMAAIPGAGGDFVYVADNPQKDFIAPNRLGWRTIQIIRPGGLYAGVEVAPEYRAQRQISSLFELKSL